MLVAPVLLHLLEINIFALVVSKYLLGSRLALRCLAGVIGALATKLPASATKELTKAREQPQPHKKNEKDYEEEKPEENCEEREHGEIRLTGAYARLTKRTETRERNKYHTTMTAKQL